MSSLEVVAVVKLVVSKVIDFHSSNVETMHDDVTARKTATRRFMCV